MIPDDRPRRLHPLSLGFRLMTHARNLLVPGLLVYFFARDNESWEIWLMALFVPSILIETFIYLTLRYRFAPGEIVVNRGLLFRNERHIPFARIQNVDLVQNLLHRLTGVAEVRLETGSGGQEQEAVLKVISLDAVEEIRRRVFADRTAPTNSTATESVSAPRSPASSTQARVIHRLGPRDLVRLGIVTNRGIALVAVAVGIGWEYGAFEKIELRETIEGFMHSFEWLGAMLVGAGLLTAAAVGLIALSIVWAFLRFWGYTLERRGDDLRIQCGLLTRRSATVPRRRVQFVTVYEGLLHRLFRRASIRIETAGGATEEDQTVSGRWFVPLVTREELPRILDEIHPAFNVTGQSDWTPPDPRGRRRMIVLGCIIASLVGGILSGVFWPWGLGILATLLVLAVWLAFVEFRFMRYAVGENGVFFRSGALNRKWSATIFEKVQVVSLGETPFDRRHGHVTLRLDTAGAGPADHRMHIRYLAAETGRELANVLALRTQRSEFHW